MVEGKKVDVVCKLHELGKTADLYVEAKDKAGLLQRADVSQIIADYSGVIQRGEAARLLIVTRGGLASGAQALVESQNAVFHQTIWELEDSALGLVPYVSAQRTAFDDDGLSKYYIPARAKVALYDDDQRRSLCSQDQPLFEIVLQWIEKDRAPPMAVLGGYGAGKSSFASRLLSHQAEKALGDPSERRPVLVKLGNITRSVGLDGLLGSLFTSEYEVRGYSFRRFKELNAKGRLLIILDGFDEMKHAMTWTEFRNEIAELNTLNEGRSRVLLLGRPNAFTSDDEHLEVLRGRRRVQSGTRRLHDWPEFLEYELQPFTRQERREFIGRFLDTSEQERCLKEGKVFDTEAVQARAVEVNKLADQDEEVFEKPVHSRILVELALDPDFDLTGFGGGLTRWELYSEFFSLLARRETSKAARSPIEAKYRLSFLRQVALWLWEDREGSTSFRASDVPATVLVNLPDGDTENYDDKNREYLAGAFLERKSGDAFFFPHRSFAEFLVAEQLALNAPNTRQHERYCALVRDGVESFLYAVPAELNVARWCRTLARGSGQLTPDYLIFLSEISGGFDKMAAQIDQKSLWRPLLSLLGTEAANLQERQHAIAQAILQEGDEAIALMLSTVTHFPTLLHDPEELANAPDPLMPLSNVVAAAIIQRVIGSVREDDPMPRHTVPESSAFMLQIAQASIRIEGGAEARMVYFSWPKLAEALKALTDSMTDSVSYASESNGFKDLAEARIPYSTIRTLMQNKPSRFFHEMVLKKGGMNTVSVVSQTSRRG